VETTAFWAAASFSLVRAQAQGVRRIGVIEADVKLLVEARKEGLRRLGWIEGQNIVVEHLRWGDQSPAAFQKLAHEITRLRIEVVMASSNQHIDAARAATTTIPIVMVYATDPVAQGYIASLAHPGGNITGLARDPGSEMRSKLVELLAECRPGLSRVAGLVHPDYGGYQISWRHVETAVRARGIAMRVLEVREARDVAGAFEAAVKDHVQAVIVGDGVFLWSQKQRIAELAARHHLPTAYPYREGPDAGGLLSYGVNLPAAWQRAAVYVDKILKGAKPADLPVEQPTMFEFVVNQKTAKSLGLTLPSAVLLRANDVIQ
jgi:putative tryptophan/tyrosine transport system substrate-binding protein